MGHLNINDPVWVLGVQPGFFAGLELHSNKRFVRVGVVTQNGPVGALVPEEWITEREING